MSDDRAARWAGAGEAGRALRDMFVRVEQYAIEHPDPPEGLCLEVHPSAYYAALREWLPDATDLTMPAPVSPFRRVKVPVRVNQNLRYGEWRLAVITVDVIAGGTIPDGPGGNPPPS